MMQDRLYGDKTDRDETFGLPTHDQRVDVITRE